VPAPVSVAGEDVLTVEGGQSVSRRSAIYTATISANSGPRLTTLQHDHHELTVSTMHASLAQ
jgi:hypothetical protein